MILPTSLLTLCALFWTLEASPLSPSFVVQNQQHPQGVLPVPTSPAPTPVEPRRGDHTQTLLQNLALRPELSKLYSLVSKRKYFANALNQTDADLTLFAPTNEAFDKFRGLPDDNTLNEVPFSFKKRIIVMKTSNNAYSKFDRF